MCTVLAIELFKTKKFIHFWNTYIFKTEVIKIPERYLSLGWFISKSFSLIKATLLTNATLNGCWFYCSLISHQNYLLARNGFWFLTLYHFDFCIRFSVLFFHAFNVENKIKYILKISLIIWKTVQFIRSENYENFIHIIENLQGQKNCNNTVWATDRSLNCTHYKQQL